MPLLLLVSFVWAFSFGLIKNRLAGLDSSAVAAVRIGLSALVFLPFLRFEGTSTRQRVQLATTGAVQFGAMYLFYLQAFHYLHAYEVALFTITTPLLVTLIDAIMERRSNGLFWAAAALSVAGAAVVVWKGSSASGDTLTGFWLVQLSNACFAVGQLAYRRIRSSLTALADYRLFGWLYLGGVAATLAYTLQQGAWHGFSPTPAQWGILAYLGILASGVCFFLWNRGATQVNAGTLAAMNNAKIPLAVACSLLFFGEQADWMRLLVGGALLAASVTLAERARSAR
ncbi:EamA family transporter [Opitutaceae bacterium EW11]|nr:EamA family transporter [Opitutaceae bacterium EW11]